MNEGEKVREGHCDRTRESESECICMHRHRDFLWPYLSFYVLCSWVCGSTTLLMTCRDGGEREGMKKKRAGWGYNSLDCSSKTLSGVTHRRDVLIKQRPCEEEVSVCTHTHTHAIGKAPENKPGFSVILGLLLSYLSLSMRQVNAKSVPQKESSSTSQLPLLLC